MKRTLLIGIVIWKLYRKFQTVQQVLCKDLSAHGEGAMVLTVSSIRLFLIAVPSCGDHMRAAVRVVTLGPKGTCHERAAIEYMSFQEIDDFEIEFVGDFFDGLERIRGQEKAFLIQCSAHPKVHEVTERYYAEVFVVDTFIYPTKALAILSRGEVEKPKTLGLVPATSGYIDFSDWDEIIAVQSKPIVAEELLAGRYEAGLTHLEHLDAHPDELRLVSEIGEVDTTWIVYGTTKRFERTLVGIPSPELFLA